MKEKNKDDTLDHLITTSHQQQLDDRRSNFEQSKHYRESKRKNVMTSLYNGSDNEAIEIGWKLEKCRRFNVNRFYHPTRKVLGPWWNRVVKETVGITDPNENNKLKRLHKDYLDNKIDYKTYTRKSRKLKWEINDWSNSRKLLSSFKTSMDEVNTKVLNNYLKKTSTKQPCQSLWCPNCRYVAKQSYLSKVETHLKRGRYLDSGSSIRKDLTSYFEENMDDNPYHQKYDYNNDDLNHVTGVVGLFPIDSDIINKLLKGDEKNRWKRIKRRLIDYNLVPSVNDPWFESVYEFELVNWKFLNTYKGNKDGKKKRTIKALMKRDKVGKKFLFVHFHALTNLTKDEISKVFKKEYWIDDDTRVPNTNPVSGLYVQSLRKTKTFKENIDTICSYPFKDPYRYKHTFIGDDYSNGEPFTKNELKEMIKLYQNVQGNNWKSLFRSLSISNIVERDRYASFYNSNHSVWNIMDKVWIVDSEGYVFKYGWNPDQHPSFNKINVMERVFDRSPKGRKYGYYKYMKPHKLLIYSNVYDQKSYYETWKPVEMTLWEYYNSKIVHTTSESAYEKYGKQMDIARKLNPTVQGSPSYHLGNLYRDQVNGIRTIIGSTISFDIDKWDSFFKLYNSVEEYNYVLKELGIPRKSLNYKRFLKLKNRSKGLGYIDKIDYQHKHTETKIFDEPYFDLEEGYIDEPFEDTREFISPLTIWMERERKDTYPKGYRKSILDDYGLDDDEVFDVIEDEIDLNTPLQLPNPNQ